MYIYCKLSFLLCFSYATFSFATIQSASNGKNILIFYDS